MKAEMNCRTPNSAAVAVACFSLASVWLVLADEPPVRKADSAGATNLTKIDLPKELFAGKVVMLLDALKRHGIKSYDEVKAQVVLETDDGELIPILPDWRGRAFFQDERLRNRRVELVGVRRPKVPYLQVLMIFVIDDKGVRQYMDYWCDVCSIAMYEIKPCECCQDPIRLRLQPRELPDFIKPRKGVR